MAKSDETADLPSVSRDINGSEYSATILPYSRWVELTEFLAKLLGQPLASALRGESLAPANLDGDAIVEVLSMLSRETAEIYQKQPDTKS